VVAAPDLHSKAKKKKRLNLRINAYYTSKSSTALKREQKETIKQTGECRRESRIILEYLTTLRQL
jgi:hypothetical protein